MKKALTYFLVGITFCITILPLLVFDGLFFPFITSKAFAFRFLVEFGVIALLLLATMDKKFIPKITPVTVFFFVFVGVMLIADLLGLNVTRSVWSNFERMEGWVMLAHLFGLFLIFDRVLFVNELWKRFLQASLGVSFLVGVHGAAQLLGYAEIHQGGVRLDANFGNATYLAVYTLFHIFFAAWLFFSTKVSWLRFLYVGVGALNLVLLYFSGTRGALLGLIGGVFVSLLVYGFAKKSKKILSFGLGFVLLSVLGLGVLSAYKEHSVIKDDPVLTRIADISFQAGETRFRIWDIALQGFYERPLLGWGQGNFNLVFSKYYNPKLYAQEPWFDRAHNVFLDWLIAGGAFGLLAYLLFFLSLFFFVWRGSFSPTEKGLVIGALSAYAINNLFVFDNLLSYVPFVFIAAFVSSRVVRTYSLPKILLPISITQSLIIIIGLCVVYVVNIPALNANGALLRALNGTYALEERRTFFVEALSYNSFADQEIREQMVQVALLGVRSPNLSDQAKFALIADAAIEIGKQAQIMEESARIHILYGIMLRLLGSFEDAEVVLERAYNAAPNKQSVIFEYALTKDLLGKQEEAVALFKKAYELEPGYSKAEELYRAILEKYENSAIVSPK
ncbi:MAG: O-antigen ligase family protein [Patescibacteria group bacterium UBA2103]